MNSQSHLDQNLDSVLEVQRRERESLTKAQKRVERVSRIIGRPMFLAGMLGFVAVWVVANEVLARLHALAFDPFPYPLLDGVLSIAALGTTVVILIAQSRQTRVEQQHAHIALQVNLLSEQKVTKLIGLLEELRRDLPMVRDRVDPQLAVLAKHSDAAEIHSAMQGAGLTHEAQSAVDDGRGPSV